jgi:branched-chain amino acid transport system substrate-binding protein
MPIEAGAAQINDAFKEMVHGGIDVNGASGPLDWDVETGEADANIQIWCMRTGGDGKLGYFASGATFDAKQKMLIGKPTGCP